MNTTSESANSSLAQRIAKVRNCMLVEAATDVSVTNKALFLSLCQIYEQQSTVTSCPPNESPQNLSHPTLLSSLDQAIESVLQHDVAATSGKDTVPKQHRFGFSAISCSNWKDFDDWADWDK